MASRSPSKLIGQVKQPQYAFLRSLTDEQALDAASLEALVNAAVNDRMALARSFIEAAKVLAVNGDSLVRRSAVSRAYYGAYHAARATVFAVRRHDEDDHEALAQAIDAVLGDQPSMGTALKELRRLRNEMDYSPYPGPGPQNQYDAQEIEDLIRKSLGEAENLIRVLEQHLQERR